jgi:hypothetical protein
MSAYRDSVVESDDRVFFLGREGEKKILCVVGDAQAFEGEQRETVFVGPLSRHNLKSLQEVLPWLAPQCLGLKRALGAGDRLGLATAGHLRAFRKVEGVAPVLAQQSMRENARTGRTPQQVLDDAAWGVFQAGWSAPWGADADHLKSVGDVDRCIEAGYTFYTADPGDYVDGEAHTASRSELEDKLAALCWSGLDDSVAKLRRRYLGKTFSVEGQTLTFDESALFRAACKYGRALAHTAVLFRHLKYCMEDRPFEFEVSVDETETPTSPLEHLFVATELRRLGVEWVSLAPRYVGRFEKGVDYIGDLDRFEEEFALHAAIARTFGPYKLSLHSGSDKFSIYPAAARCAGDLLHVKTAGTSYLEALLVMATHAKGLFREILEIARERYEEDRATYHISAKLSMLPVDVSDEELPWLLDDFHAREILHVTYGSVLDRLGETFMEVLAEHEQAYHHVLEDHFVRHLTLMGGDPEPKEGP